MFSFKTIESISLKDRATSSGFLFVALLLISFDILEDALSGVSLVHMLFEVGILSSISLGILVLWLKFRESSTQTNLLKKRTEELSDETVFWKEKSEKFIRGLSLEIDNQFKRWKLTDSEREIGFLILKGLTNDEIAEIRNTSTKTVKIHVGHIYKKSGLHSRGELSAFFLEDLFVPTK